jgi:hypothetical protein
MKAFEVTGTIDEKGKLQRKPLYQPRRNPQHHRRV